MHIGHWLAAGPLELSGCVTPGEAVLSLFGKNEYKNTSLIVWPWGLGDWQREKKSLGRCSKNGNSLFKLNECGIFHLKAKTYFSFIAKQNHDLSSITIEVDASNEAHCLLGWVLKVPWSLTTGWGRPEFTPTTSSHMAFFIFFMILCYSWAILVVFLALIYLQQDKNLRPCSSWNNRLSTPVYPWIIFLDWVQGRYRILLWQCSKCHFNTFMRFFPVMSLSIWQLNISWVLIINIKNTFQSDVLLPADDLAS